MTLSDVHRDERAPCRKCQLPVGLSRFRLRSSPHRHVSQLCRERVGVGSAGAGRPRRHSGVTLSMDPCHSNEAIRGDGSYRNSARRIAGNDPRVASIGCACDIRIGPRERRLVGAIHLNRHAQVRGLAGLGSRYGARRPNPLQRAELCDRHAAVLHARPREAATCGSEARPRRLAMGHWRASGGSSRTEVRSSAVQRLNARMSRARHSKP